MSSDFPLDNTEDEDGFATSLGGSRAEAIHRLQVGMFGLGAIVLMVGLANIVMERAKQSDATAVPEAAATVAGKDTTTSNKDPLADAGVVPDLPSEKDSASASVENPPPASH